MIIRKATLNDSDEIAKIAFENFTDPWSKEAFETEIKNIYRITLVAEIDEIICGYITGTDMYGEATIDSIAVKKDFQHQTIGNKLLNEFTITIKSNQITLEVRESNQKAISLYKKNKFIIAGIRKKFYEKPVENAIVMIKMKEE